VKRILRSLFFLLMEVLLTFFAGFGVMQYFLRAQVSNPIVQRVSMVLVTGLAAGFSSRFLFRKWHFFWKMLLSLLAIGVVITLLDKIFPGNYELVFIDRKPWGEPIGIDLLQIGMGFVMSLLALLVGKRRKQARVIESRPRAAIQAKKKARISKPRQLFFQRESKRNRRKKNVQKISKPPARKTILSNRSLSGYRITNLVTSKSRRIRSRDVKLLGETEHRCPYCLELVKKNDARGVVVCPECKTWHHKDCWDVTGSCQVAHRHEL
jgi:hypothetical protein